MKSSLPGSTILHSAALFLIGLALTIALGLLAWPKPATPKIKPEPLKQEAQLQPRDVQR